MTTKDKVLLYPNDLHVDIGSHVVLLYKNPSEYIEFVSHFFHQGLKNDDICIYINEESKVLAEVTDEVRRKGGVNETVLKENVTFVDYQEFYFTNGKFLPDTVFEKIDALLNTYVAKRVRAVGNDSWVDKAFFDNFHQYEIDLSKKYNNKNMVIVCAYHLEQYDIEQVVKLTQSHSLIVYKNGKGEWKISETVEKEIYGQKVNELEKFTNVAVDRELKMVELKQQIEKLQKELSKHKLD